MREGILGIDPGDKGALCLLKEDASQVYDIPVIRISKTRVEVDIPELVDLLARLRAPFIYVEKMQSLPKGTNANFKRGGYLYLFRGLCASRGYALVEVPPKEWQKEFGIKTTKEDDTKGQSYQIASRLFPLLDFKNERGTLLDGRCDAALIAEYGRRREAGTCQRNCA